MGVRSRIADQIRKVFGNTEPAAVAADERAAGMDTTRPFSPGEPIGPYDGFSRVPRSREFVTGYNIAARPRSHERVAFETLRGLIDAYDVAQICIWHRIDSIRALDWALVPARGFSGDTDAAIDLGMKALEKPDRQTPFAGWLAKYLYDVLAYDAGTLYRTRNRRGDPIGMEVIDGTTVAPLLDYWGRSPKPPAEAYVQYVNGLPWNWLTRDDLVYEPFRPRANSPYGTAPLEAILLNANTDLRFQAYFMQRFTDGNLPAAFAAAPETWSPNQIEQFQEYWDAFMLGDQSTKHQIRWIPGGSDIAWSNEKDFDDHFSLFLMRKTCSAFHVVPSDLGFTETVNKSSGETQADVQHRVGDLPLVAHIEGILTGFLRRDLGLPLAFKFDTGQEKEDRLAQAQAWQIYIESGMASPDEGREELLGLPGDPRRPTPRFFSTTRSGPIPLLAIEGVAGRVDPETFGPAETQPAVYQPFVAPPGVIPAVHTTDAAASVAAEDAYQTQMREQLQAQGTEVPVVKNGTPTVGIAAGTGIVGYDLIGHHAVEEDDEEQRTELTKAELSAFRSFRKARARAGRWRDFEFRHVDPVRARRLNQAGRAEVRKAAGEVAVAGLAVQAADTGRVLMLQRALDDEDPAAGMWECPGGHIEPGETPLQGAWREWAEEVGAVPPPGEMGGTWTSPDGVYQGIVWRVPSEDYVSLDGRDQVSNPDDPDGDVVEAIAWWDPAQLPGNPAVRPELAATVDDVLAALGVESIAKVAGGGVHPKAPDPAHDRVWPGWAWDTRVADHWTPKVAATSAAALTATQAGSLVRDYRRTGPRDTIPDRRAAVAAVAAWLAAQGVTVGQPLTDLLTGLYTDGYLVGAASARAVVDDDDPEFGDWTPGDTDTAQRLLDALGAAGLAAVLATIPDAVQRILDGQLNNLARALIDGVDADDPDDDIAADLLDRLGDLDWAAGVALTAVVTAAGLAAIDTYSAAGVDLGQWVVDPTSKVCATCADNAAAGPVPIGAAYPSGDSEPPIHPRCRCSIEPA